MYLQVVSTGTCGTCPSLLLSLESEKGRVYARYLINAGEGTQRLCMEYGIKTQRFAGILLTQGDACHTGGLGGLHFSLADAGAARLDVRGPDNALKAISAYSKFVRRRWPEFKGISLQSSSSKFAKFERIHGILHTLVVTISTKAPVRDEDEDDYYCYWCEATSNTSDDDDSSSDEDSSEDESDGDSDENDREENDGESGLETDSSSDARSSTSICVKDQMKTCDKTVKLESCLCYIFQTWEKIKPNGVEPEPDSRSFFTAVVDCPSLHHIDDLINCVHFKRNGKECSHGISLMVHLAHVDIISTGRYQKWMKSLKSTRHVCIHQSNFTRSEFESEIFHKSRKWSLKMGIAAPDLFPDALNVCNPGQDVEDYCASKVEIFPMAKFSVSAIEGESIVDHKSSVKPEFDMAQITTEVKLALSMTEEIERDVADPNEIDLESSSDVILPLDSKRPRLSERTKQASPDGTRLVFLGTGAAKPARLRGCSSILLHFQDVCRGHLLFDCGEGTCGQLIRLYGIERATKIVSELSGVWISHHHLDHHGGLIRLMEMRRGSQLRSRLVIWGPKKVGDSLFEYFGDLGENEYDFYHCSQVHQGRNDLDKVKYMRSAPG